MRIVYCLDQIDATGGLERITVTKANALAKIPGNEVFILVAFNRNCGVNHLEGVNLIDLDVQYYNDIGLGPFGGFFFMLKKRREHKMKARSILNALSPDIVISTGMAEKHFLKSIKINSNPVIIRELHFEKYYRRHSAQSVAQRIISVVSEFLDYTVFIKGYDKIIVLTEEDHQTNWHDDPKVAVMPNPIAHHSAEKSSYSNNTVIAVGRLERQKNFCSLIDAWREVVKKHPNWCLKIYGQGSLNNSLQRQIDDYGLARTCSLEGFTSEIMHHMAPASFFALSSITEGMPLVMLEAMSCGLPVVSYTCPSGPRDIVSNGINGFLVPLNDTRLLADRICMLMDDRSLIKRMGANAIETSKQFTLEKIIPRWMALFNQLLDEKRIEN